MTGKVKWFDRNKGYGYILTEEGNELFVHVSGVQKRADGSIGLVEGQEVTFRITEGKRGPQASDVVVMA